MFSPWKNQFQQFCDCAGQTGVTKGDIFWGWLFLCFHVFCWLQLLSSLGCCTVRKLGHIYPSSLQFLTEDTESHHLLLTHCDEVSPPEPLLILKLHFSSWSELKNMLCEINRDVCAVPASKEWLMYFHQSIAESYKSHFSAESCKSCLWFKLLL